MKIPKLYTEEMIADYDSRIAKAKASWKPVTIKVIFKAEGFIYSVAHYPEQVVVSIFKENDKKIPESWLVIVQEEAKLNDEFKGVVVEIPAETKELARVEIQDRVIGMMNMAFMGLDE